MQEHIQYDFVYDNHFSDLKENELRNDQLGVVAAMEPYIGKYFSAQYIRSKVLKQSDGQMKEIDAQIEKEIKEKQFITTGVYLLDAALSGRLLGGGVASNRITAFAGESGAGKSSEASSTSPRLFLSFIFSSLSCIS